MLLQSFRLAGEEKWPDDIRGFAHAFSEGPYYAIKLGFDPVRQTILANHGCALQQRSYAKVKFLLRR
jgi:hypothetical protein